MATLLRGKGGGFIGTPGYSVNYEVVSQGTFSDTSRYFYRPGINCNQLLAMLLQAMGVTESDQPEMPGYGSTLHDRRGFRGSGAHYPKINFNAQLPLVAS